MRPTGKLPASGPLIFRKFDKKFNNMIISLIDTLLSKLFNSEVEMKEVLTKTGPVSISDEAYYKLLSMYIIYRNVSSILLQIATMLSGVRGLSWKTFYQETIDD